MTVAEKLASWLDDIGADGLMYAGKRICDNDDIGSFRYVQDLANAVPSYRHADGSYHMEPEHWFLCKTCICDCMPIGDDACGARFDARECMPYQSWLSHKEAK